MRMKKENDRRNHVGTTFEMAFDTTPNCQKMSHECFPSWFRRGGFLHGEISGKGAGRRGG